MIKFYTGKIIGTIGAYLWKNGGWTRSNNYEDLKVIGKLGYQMFLRGLKLMGFTPDELKTYLNNR